MTKKIVLLDGMNLAFRAFYAIPFLTAKDGQPVNAVLGFLNMLTKLIDGEKPDYIAVAFDLPDPTFRDEIYKEYKGTRGAMPSELKSQIPIIKNLLRKMEIKIYEASGYEADDVLGTLARQSQKEGLFVTIISADRDLFQLVTDDVCIKIPGKMESSVYFAKDIKEKIGVTPKEYIDVKALMGDASDNVPGVPSIGEKTAVKIVKEFGSVENAIENFDKITPRRVSKNLDTFREQALLSKKLVTIDLKAPVALELSELENINIYSKEVFEEIKRLEFRSLYDKFSFEDVTHKIITIEDDEKIVEFVSEILGKEEVAYKLVYSKNSFEGISFAFDSDREFFVKAAFTDLDEGRLISVFKRFFEGNVNKIAYDSKEASHKLKNFGVSMNNLEFDVMLGGYVLNRDREYNNALELYNAYVIMKSEIKESGLEDLYYGIELPLSFILLDMENYGIKVDKEELIRYGEILSKRIDGLTGEIYNLSGEEFNINSTKQLGAVLFDKLGLFASKKTKTGYSTAADVLEKLTGKHPVIPKILEYRHLTKLKSTYVDGLLAVMTKDGKIFSTFKQAVTSTGRLSSTEPNLQNIPVRTELGRELRKVFVPSKPGYVFIDADYSQIELRVLAHMSGDENFIRAFRNNEDIHRLTASEVFNVPPELVTLEQRSNAKAVNFGVIYGQSAFSFASDLNISFKEAEKYIRGYFKKYPKVKSFMEETVNKAKEDGYTLTISGRRRNIPELISSNHATRSFGERAAMNMPIQGSAADIIKIAMIKVCERLKKEGLKAQLILQIHDELLLEVPENEIDTVKSILKSEMESAVELKVPLTVDMKVGINWFEAK